MFAVFYRNDTSSLSFFRIRFHYYRYYLFRRLFIFQSRSRAARPRLGAYRRHCEKCSFQFGTCYLGVWRRCYPIGLKFQPTKMLIRKMKQNGRQPDLPGKISKFGQVRATLT